MKCNICRNNCEAQTHRRTDNWVRGARQGRGWEKQTEGQGELTTVQFSQAPFLRRFVFTTAVVIVARCEFRLTRHAMSDAKAWQAHLPTDVCMGRGKSIFLELAPPCLTISVSPLLTKSSPSSKSAQLSHSSTWWWSQISISVLTSGQSLSQATRRVSKFEQDLSKSDGKSPLDKPRRSTSYPSSLKQ
jgi:hypothetical protein